jgi:diguanylate cyclase (GGDEF)-like protein
MATNVNKGRRREDSRSTERRNDRRRNEPEHHQSKTTCRNGSWADQKLQFITRYLFCIIGVIYFNYGFDYQSPWMTLAQMNGFFAAYMIWNSVLFAHAATYLKSHLRLRVGLWGDVVGISIVVLNDPYIVPLTSMVYIVIVLGNGMRYGMRCFTEAVIASFFLAMLTLSLRYHDTLSEVMPAVIFMNLFGALILLYSYVLMARVEESRQELRDNSRIDPLTILLNRSALKEEADYLFDVARQRGHGLMVVFADLDRFKTVNDTYGHAEGDRVLCSIAGIIRNCIRDSDVAARYGGDEFVVLLQNVDEETAIRICNRIQMKLNKWVRDKDYNIGLSMGLGEAMRHGHNLDDVLDRVDQALYQCKGQSGLSIVTLT